MTSGRLLTRLLLVASPSLAACSSDPAMSGTSGYTPAAPRADGASAGVPGRADTTPPPALLAPLDPPTPSGHRAIRPPSAPLKPARGMVQVVDSTGEQPGEHPLSVCSAEFYSWPTDASGGPFPLAACYQPTSLPHACIEATAPQLNRLLGGKVTGPSCVYSGPHAQTSPDSGAPWCCYSLGFMGEGRPLVLDGARRAAPLAAGSGWA